MSNPPPQSRPVLPAYAVTDKHGKPKTYPLMSRAEIEALIADGRNIIIVNQQVLKCDLWLPYHPGGDLAIQHMVGRDATDEVAVYEWSLPYPSLKRTR